MSYPSLIAETVTLVGHDDNSREAYYARPRRDAKFPGVVGVHHQPSWDEWITEVVRKFRPSRLCCDLPQFVLPQCSAQSG